MVCRSWSRCPCCLNVRPTLSCCRERFVWCCLFDMYLEFVCSRIILPRRVLHALFCLLTECDGCQDSRLTDHIKTRPPRNKTIPGGCFCVVSRSIISEMLCNFGNSSYNFSKTIRISSQKYCGKFTKGAQRWRKFRVICGRFDTVFGIFVKS